MDCIQLSCKPWPTRQVIMQTVVQQDSYHANLGPAERVCIKDCIHLSLPPLAWEAWRTKATSYYKSLLVDTLAQQQTSCTHLNSTNINSCALAHWIGKDMWSTLTEFVPRNKSRFAACIIKSRACIKSSSDIYTFIGISKHFFDYLKCLRIYTDAFECGTVKKIERFRN